MTPSRRTTTRRLLLALLLFLLPASAFAQATVLQGGSWSLGQVPTYSSSGGSQPVVQSAGPAGGGGAGINEIAVIAQGTGSAPFAGQGTGPLGTNICDYDGPTSSAAGYHFLCLSANAQGGGLIAYGSGGAAGTLPLKMSVNGTTYEFPFTISGIVGPNPSTLNAPVCWNNTSGTLLKDCAAQTQIITCANTAADVTTINTALAVGGVVQLGPGVCQVGVSSLAITTSNTWLRGSGVGVTTLRLPVGSPFNGDIIKAFNGGAMTDVAITDLTIDGNNNLSGSNSNIFAQGVTNLVVQNVEIVKMYSKFGITAQVVTNFSISNNRCTLTTARTSQNQCILGTNVSPNTNGVVANNVLVNSSIEFEGSYILFSGNDISGWQYGAGIASGPGALSHNHIYSSNHIHDSGLLADANGVYPTGLEIWAYNSVISNNVIFNCADNGIYSGGRYNAITGNVVYDNVRAAAAQVQGHAGIFIGQFTADPFEDGSYNTVNSNVVYNTAGAAGPQPYAFRAFTSGLLTGVTVGVNSFGVGSAGTTTGTFTAGTLYTPTLSNPTVSGTMTFPDTSTWTSTGPIVKSVLGVGAGLIPVAGATSKIQSVGDLSFMGSGGAAFWNLYYDGAFKYSTNGYGYFLGDDTAGNFSFYTAPLNAGGAGAAAAPVRSASMAAATGAWTFDAVVKHSTDVRQTVGATFYLGASVGADTITFSPTTPYTGYTVGALYGFLAGGTNTGAATGNISTLGAKAIVKRAATALVAGDIVTNGFYWMAFDGVSLHLLNPTVP